MDKQEARVKCTGCGTSYKLKVPVTDKPVNFKCKKCGKVLKIKVAAPPEAEAAAPRESPPPRNEMEFGTLPGLETTQLPDSDDFYDQPTTKASTPPRPSAPTRPVQAPAKTREASVTRPAAPAGPNTTAEAQAQDESYEPDFGDLEAPPTFDDDIPDDMPTFDPDQMFEQREKQKRMQKESAITAQREQEELAEEKTQRQVQASMDVETIARLAEDAQAREKVLAAEQYEQIERAKEKARKKQEGVLEHGYADHLKAATAMVQRPGAEDLQVSSDTDRRWLVLDEEQVRGPFTDAEVMAMIDDGEITSETPLRMGQRPWIKAAQVSDFKQAFGIESRSVPRRTRAHVPLTDLPEAGDEEEQVQGPLFYEQFAAILPYPLGGGNWQPVAIFAGIAFVLCTALSFDFLIGLPVAILGWIFLYGYLGEVMNRSEQAPATPPPNWDFSAAKDLLMSGLQLFLVLLVFCLVPLSVMLLFMIAFFLNGMDIVGYVFIGLTVMVYAGSLFVTPAALVISNLSGRIGAAFSPAMLLAFIKNGRKPYQMLGATSVAAGLAGMVVVLLAVFLAEIPVAGFVVAGLVMALVLSYANFIWFHVLGRFCRENSKLTRQVFALAKS